jgi:hypothetical protein
MYNHTVMIKKMTTENSHSESFLENYKKFLIIKSNMLLYVHINNQTATPL